MKMSARLGPSRRTACGVQRRGGPLRIMGIYARRSPASGPERRVLKISAASRVVLRRDFGTTAGGSLGGALGFRRALA